MCFSLYITETSLTMGFNAFLIEHNTGMIGYNLFYNSTGFVTWPHNNYVARYSKDLRPVK